MTDPRIAGRLEQPDEPQAEPRADPTLLAYLQGRELVSKWRRRGQVIVNTLYYAAVCVATVWILDWVEWAPWTSPPSPAEVADVYPVWIDPEWSPGSEFPLITPYRLPDVDLVPAPGEALVFVVPEIDDRFQVSGPAGVPALEKLQRTVDALIPILEDAFDVDLICNGRSGHEMECHVVDRLLEPDDP